MWSWIFIGQDSVTVKYIYKTWEREKTAGLLKVFVKPTTELQLQFQRLMQHWT